ncbi:hypothetical protein CJD36_004435 [Flavipsychrobacter stenotrophus]|uniref:Uncharacterized protein n=1 Tax=Flavipsychrobacter stenotrophus TaxID=2077091 RepID=A0A2S7T2C6_9BACT|nr:hypothetical protein [Flavipsychrobacter stenotrophus]PQJ12997.1 hypothetical protein CJD36_004435 [Flavipsychrobacter stenotrophus]
MKSKLLYGISALIIGIIIGVISTRFYERREITEINSSRLALSSIDNLKSKVLHGDIEAYTKLRGEYRDYPPENFLFWAMYMANKYDYAYAYEDVFRTMEESYNIDSAIFNMDDKTRKFAFTYLKMAAQKGDSSAMATLNDMLAKQIATD